VSNQSSKFRQQQLPSSSESSAICRQIGARLGIGHRWQSESGGRAAQSANKYRVRFVPMISLPFFTVHSAGVSVVGISRTESIENKTATQLPFTVTFYVTVGGFARLLYLKGKLDRGTAPRPGGNVVKTLIITFFRLAGVEADEESALWMLGKVPLYPYMKAKWYTDSTLQARLWQTSWQGTAWPRRRRQTTVDLVAELTSSARSRLCTRRATARKKPEIVWG
ncbi:hypothetical protein THAOC_19646, partial [Thalassiosira oceanica]